jgi:asparagine synthetase B (glutamine-hydrolysing)
VQEELVAREAEAVRKEASRQHTLKAALVEKIDPTTMSRSEIIRVERATALVVKIQERVKERQQEADSQQAERDRQDEETRLQEEELRRMEQGTSTPRSLRRRKVVRELDRAVRRQERGQFVCEYGCKDWIASRSARDEHRSRACRLRQVYCTFECGLHMREDEWLADNYQLTHECEECPNRLVYCPLNCLEW